MINLSLDELQDLALKSVKDGNYEAAVKYFDLILEQVDSIVIRQKRNNAYFLMRINQSILCESQSLLFPQDNYFCFEEDMPSFLSFIRDMYNKSTEFLSFNEDYDCVILAFCSAVHNNVQRRFVVINQKVSCSPKVVPNASRGETW